MHGGARRSNGVSGIPVVNRKVDYCHLDNTSLFNKKTLYQVALSLLWVVASLALVIFGFWHCRSKGFHYTIQCDYEDCKLSSYGLTTEITKFKKVDFVDAEFVRIDKEGNFADPAKIKREKRAKFGYSIRLKIRQPVDEGSRIKTERYSIYNPNDMGRRQAKSGAQRIKDFLDGKTKQLYLNNGKTVTMIGVLSIFFGLVSMLVACVLGQWEDVNPRRLKKAS